MSPSAASLALNGGPKAKTVPYGTGRRFGDAELAALQEALAQGTLFYGMGKMVRRACDQMRAYTGLPHVAACSSCSAAIHLALAAAGVGPGDEVICTPNTDAGSVLGAIVEGAVPVFCDCELNLQPSARTVAARLTERTRAVVVVHLAGAPAPVEEIVALCEPRGVAVIEDCAQSWGTRIGDRRIGTFGLAACYSVNDYKHISCGDGGFVALRDEALYRRVLNYGDKHYDRFYRGELRQAHLGLNYRMSELQGAVTCAQLAKVEQITARYHEMGERLRALLADVPGLVIPAPIPGGYSTYWWIYLGVTPASGPAGRDRICQAIQAEGVPLYSYGKYDLIDAPLFQKRIVRPWVGEAWRQFPFVQPDGRSYTYSLEQTPNHKHLLEHGMMFSLNAFYTDQDIAETAAAVRKVFAALAPGA